MPRALAAALRPQLTERQLFKGVLILVSIIGRGGTSSKDCFCCNRKRALVTRVLAWLLPGAVPPASGTPVLAARPVPRIWDPRAGRAVYLSNLGGESVCFVGGPLAPLLPWGWAGRSPGSKGPRAGGLLKCGRSVLPGAPTHESCLFSPAS